MLNFHISAAAQTLETTLQRRCRYCFASIWRLSPSYGITQFFPLGWCQSPVAKPRLVPNTYLSQDAGLIYLGCRHFKLKGINSDSSKAFLKFNVVTWKSSSNAFRRQDGFVAASRTRLEDDIRRLRMTPWTISESHLLDVQHRSRNSKKPQNMKDEGEV
jgi:hypothetical protein